MAREKLLVVGAGLSGAVLGRALAEAGHAVHIAEARDHVAGNCHTLRDAETGVMVHAYGPHVFHTSDDEIWRYVNDFARFRPYVNQVKATVGRHVYTLPVNLETINQFFARAMHPDEARAFLAGLSEPSPGAPESFESVALARIGRALYEAFFKGYTEKQWGRAPADLPASVFTRLPLRFDYNDSYYDHRYQGIPEDGYTAMVARILDHPGLTVSLDTPVTRAAALAGGWDHVFVTAPLDGWFGHADGALGYRTLDFERFIAEGDWQGCAVMNYPDRDVPWTRITEHKHFAPWEEHARSVLFREYSRDCGPADIPFYPIRLVGEKTLLARYVARARAEHGVTFLGRLGTYRYIDMDVTIREALDAAQGWEAARAANAPVPAFFASPL